MSAVILTCATEDDSETRETPGLADRLEDLDYGDIDSIAAAARE
jgi:hypothetical protein